VLRLADHLVLLEGGRVAATGPLTGLGASLALAGAAAEDDDAGTMADAVVAGHDEEYALSWLEVGGLRVTLPRVDAAPGEVRRLRFHARDVSLARHRPEATSILNVFPARVVELRPAGPSQVLAVLRLAATGGGEGVPLLASITRRSAAVLELAPGDEVWAQVKAVALVGRPTAAAAPAPPPARP
jgi:molybdate transport system ATP-binding protein